VPDSYNPGSFFGAAQLCRLAPCDAPLSADAASSARRLYFDMGQCGGRWTPVNSMAGKGMGTRSSSGADAPSPSATPLLDALWRDGHFAAGVTFVCKESVWEFVWPMAGRPAMIGGPSVSKRCLRHGAERASGKGALTGEGGEVIFSVGLAGADPEVWRRSDRFPMNLTEIVHGARVSRPDGPDHYSETWSSSGVRGIAAIRRSH